MGLAVPVLAQTNNPQLIFATATIGGILGALLTESLIAPQRASAGTNQRERRSGSLGRSSRVSVRVSAESALLAGAGLRGNHSIVALTF